MLADNPGDQEGGGSYQPSLDYPGKLTGRPSATGLIGAGPLEGIHTPTHTPCVQRLEGSGADVKHSLFSDWLLQSTKVRGRGAAACGQWEGGGVVVIATLALCLPTQQDAIVRSEVRCKVVVHLLDKQEILHFPTWGHFLSSSRRSPLF